MFYCIHCCWEIVMQLNSLNRNFFIDFNKASRITKNEWGRGRGREKNSYFKRGCRACNLNQSQRLLCWLMRILLVILTAQRNHVHLRISYHIIHWIHYTLESLYLMQKAFPITIKMINTCAFSCFSLYFFFCMIFYFLPSFARLAHSVVSFEHQFSWQRRRLTR